MNALTYTKSGAKSTTPTKLDKNTFGLQVDNFELLKLAYNAHLANSRINLAKTKSRGEVRGGGRKPHRQKGTGNARVGSSRNPIWTGGGVAFGPQGNENYKLALNKKSKSLALKQALSLANLGQKIIVIDDFKIASGKTKDAAKLLAKIGADKKTLVVMDAWTEKDKQSLNNLPGVMLVKAQNINTRQVLDADYLVITKDALGTVSGTTK